MEKIKVFEEKKQKIDWKEMTVIRYLDWSITTPMMLIVLCAALAYNIKKSVSISVISMILFLNYAMLYLGYLGETNAMDKLTAMATSFVAFFAMYLIIFYNYIKPKYNCPNYVFYGLYVAVWAMYGIVYLFEEETKNKCLNVLDVISKCFIGLGLWIYYTRIIV
jgi:hypothetical protein